MALAHVPDPRLLLDAERDETVRRLAALADDFAQVVAASRDTNADDEHDPEGATIAFERSQVDALVRQSRRALEEVDADVRRLHRRLSVRPIAECTVRGRTRSGCGLLLGWSRVRGEALVVAAAAQQDEGRPRYASAARIAA